MELMESHMNRKRPVRSILSHPLPINNNNNNKSYDKSIDFAKARSPECVI
jgi:hypothetical protein